MITLKRSKNSYDLAEEKDPTTNECPRNDTKQSEGEFPVLQKISQTQILEMI